MRADLYLYTHGFSKSRTAAQELIRTGVTVNSERIKKPSQEIRDTENNDVCILNPQRYVSRGGLKLEAALDEFGISPRWMTCADFGASTGGFTDCLLQRGAEKVFAIDVGHGQLDPRLLADKRVISMEGVNARTVSCSMLGENCGIVVTDLSFISQTLIYDSVSDTLSENGVFISLIKPQFEAGPENIGKNGIVKNPRAHEEVIEHIIRSASSKKLMIQNIIPSPIKGGDGNTEYLACFIKNGEIRYPEIRQIVNKAFEK